MQIPEVLDMSPISLFKDNDNYFLIKKEIEEWMKRQWTFSSFRGKTYKQAFLSSREDTIRDLQKAVCGLYPSDSDFDGLILYANLTRILKTVFEEEGVEVEEEPKVKWEYEPYVPENTEEIIDIMKQYILLDLETTGFGRLDQIIQVGVGFFGEREAEGTYLPSTMLQKSEFFVELYKNKVTPRITDITGIKPEDVASKGKPIRMVLEFLHKVIDGRVVAAHNARFDFTKIAELFIDFGLEPPKPSKLIDTIDCFKVISKEKGFKLSQFNLNKMAKEFLGMNIENLDERHTALFDVKTTHEALLAATTATEIFSAKKKK